MSLSSPVPSWLDALQYNPVHEQDAKVFLREVVLFTCFFLLVLSLALGLGLYWRKRPNVKGSSLSGAGVPVNSIPFVVFVLTLSMAIAIVTALPVTVFALLAVRSHAPLVCSQPRVGETCELYKFLFHLYQSLVYLQHLPRYEVLSAVSTTRSGLHRSICMISHACIFTCIFGHLKLIFVRLVCDRWPLFVFWPRCTCSL